MANHLSIPLKKSYFVDIARLPLDAYTQDISHWLSLRAHSPDIDSLTLYHAQLVFVLAKLPSDIALDFVYDHAFEPLPVSLPSLPFERAATLFNIAALYSQLASSQDRSTQQGLKRATLYQQNAAGSFSFLRTNALHKLDPDNTPLDLAPPFVSSLEFLMLAQAQECAWQHAVADHYKNSLVAKLATGVASLYSSALHALRSASPQVRDKLPSYWIPHLETKLRHFRAAAQYRKSVDDLEANNYGEELRRLIDAEAEARQGYNSARRTSVSPAVLQDIKSLLDILQTNLARAQRDNDLIYHQDVPPSSSITPIQDVIMVQNNIPPGLSDPKSVLSGRRILFEDMLGWGAREALNIYNDNKQTLIKERITDFAKELDDEIDQTLRSLNLPSSLEALERPIGLPPSLLKKAEEVRDQGADRIETYLEDVELLARRTMAILNEAMDILDSEASEDEAARKKVQIKRPPSHEANQELVQKQERYRNILIEAAASDQVVRQKWGQWENLISQLALSEDKLEKLVPSSTISAVGKVQVTGNQTQVHARALRALLESLDDVRHNRGELVLRAKRRAEVDDIKPRITAAAEKFDRDTEITPAMFADVSDEELAKYDKFIQGLVDEQREQVGLLDSIKATNDRFLSSRKDDPCVKEREQALQNLDLAYAKYGEITHNLEEGHKFYNEMTVILGRFKEACKVWSNARSQEAQSFYRKFASMSVQEPSAVVERAGVKTTPVETPRRSKRVANLPSLNSAEWKTEELPPPPPSSKTR